MERGGGRWSEGEGDGVRGREMGGEGGRWSEGEGDGVRYVGEHRGPLLRLAIHICNEIPNHTPHIHCTVLGCM